jgi:DNA-directed RNA polymerase subunit RPC12/RpoP
VMVSYREVTKEDEITGLIYVGLFLVILLGGALLLLPSYWYVWVFIIVAGIGGLVAWSTRNFGYRCGNCGKEFEISWHANFYSPHIGFSARSAKKYVKCPHCGQWSWATVLKKVRD